MVKVKFFGASRHIFGRSEVTVEATTVRGLLKTLSVVCSCEQKELKRYLIFVNDVNIVNLKMWRTKLEDGDVVMFLSPASGG